MNLQLAFSLLKQRGTVVKCNASRCSCFCICICEFECACECICGLPWIDASMLQNFIMKNTLWGGRGEAQAMRSWEGKKLCVWLSCPETFSPLSPLPPLCPQLIGKMCYNIFDGSLDCWLFYGLAYGQPLCCSIFLWPKTCWILISFILMGCGCLPSFLAWPLLKSFREQFSRISGNLIEPAMTVFSENNLNNSHWIRLVNLPAIYICNKQFSTWIYHTYKCQDICMYAPQWPTESKLKTEKKEKAQSDPKPKP